MEYSGEARPSEARRCRRTERIDTSSQLPPSFSKQPPNQFSNSSLRSSLQACSAKTGEGLQEGMEWVVEKIDNTNAGDKEEEKAA